MAGPKPDHRKAMHGCVVPREGHELADGGLGGVREVEADPRAVARRGVVPEQHQRRIESGLGRCLRMKKKIT